MAQAKSLSKTRKAQARRQPALTLGQKKWKPQKTINGSGDLLFNSRQGRGLFWTAVTPLFLRLKKGNTNAGINNSLEFGMCPLRPRRFHFS
jgi:hypothetical protein